MSQPTASQSPDIKLQKLTSPVGLVVDAVLVIGFFLFLFSILKSHVQSDDLTMIFIWAGLTSACMSGVFWLAIQMFRVVLSAQLLAKKRNR
jgi:K+-sensing histidine kinase KdpD